MRSTAAIGTQGWVGALGEVRRRAGRLRPLVGTAYLTYIDVAAHAGRPFPCPPRYELHQVTARDDPALASLPRWQARQAAALLESGQWVHVVARDRGSGDQVGHVWGSLVSTRGLLNGVVDVRLRPDEAYVFDLFIEPEHRGLALGNAMGQWLIEGYHDRGVDWGITHVDATNDVSLIWHHLFGFRTLQVFKYLHVGDRFWWKIPMSESPRFGPLSRRGRHSSEHAPDPTGGPLPPG